MDTRTICLFGMLGLPALAALNALYFGRELKSFVESTPRLESSRDLDRYKTVVAHQMYAALGQIVFLATPPIIYFAGLVLGVLHPSDLVFVILPSAVILIVAAIYRKWETRAKTISAANPELEVARDAIVRAWMRKPWPDW